ncbi:hypothetical protein [Saccharothrix sp. HUAS TT1]|uniref:hypothetical protein n=1 Tax=unclassified Saccharothrix TaxID=2593673 RepID=UPI00345B7C60
MFESGAASYAAWRPVEPPVPVLVRLDLLFPPTRLTWGRDTAMWARSRGLRLDRPVPGTVTAWAMTSVGDWLAVVTLTVVVDGRELGLTQLVPVAAVERVAADGRPGRR